MYLQGKSLYWLETVFRMLNADHDYARSSGDHSRHATHKICTQKHDYIYYSVFTVTSITLRNDTKWLPSWSHYFSWPLEIRLHTNIMYFLFPCHPQQPTLIISATTWVILYYTYWPGVRSMGFCRHCDAVCKGRRHATVRRQCFTISTKKKKILIINLARIIINLVRDKNNSDYLCVLHRLIKS